LPVMLALFHDKLRKRRGELKRKMLLCWWRLFCRNSVCVNTAL